MNIAVLGTGIVGTTIGSKLTSLGHHVMMGSRTASNEKTEKWKAHAGPNASSGTFADAAAYGEIIFNCTSGAVSLDVLAMAGANNLEGKIIVDISNPLDFSRGFPPSLTVCNTDSIGEQIQRTYPGALVVKTLNTVNAHLMVNPAKLSGDHDIFICGNDAAAKSKVDEILRQWFGWKHVVDLGDITGARAAEMYLPLWVRLYGVQGTAMFNIHIVK